MRGTLYIQIGKRGKRMKKPKPLYCKIDMGRDGTAIASVEMKIVADLLEKARVEFISADGLMITGIVKDGNNPFPVLRYQEWWFVPAQETKNGTR